MFLRHGFQQCIGLVKLAYMSPQFANSWNFLKVGNPLTWFYRGYLAITYYFLQVEQCFLLLISIHKHKGISNELLWSSWAFNALISIPYTKELLLFISRSVGDSAASPTMPPPPRRAICAILNLKQLCYPINFVIGLPASLQLWPSTSSRPTVSTSGNTTWRSGSLIQYFKDHAKPTPTFLTYTNITPIKNYKMQPASSFTFSPVQFYSTCNWGDWQNKQLTIIKPTKTHINRNK